MAGKFSMPLLTMILQGRHWNRQALESKVHASTSPSLLLVRSGPLLALLVVCSVKPASPLYEDNCFRGVGEGSGVFPRCWLSFRFWRRSRPILAQVKADAVAGVFSRFSSKLCRQAPRIWCDINHDQRTKAGLADPGCDHSLGWAASGAIMSLLEAFKAVTVAIGAPFVKTTRRGFVLVFIAAVPAIWIFGAHLFGARSERTVLAWTGECLPVDELKIWAILLGSSLRYGHGAGSHRAGTKRATHRPDNGRKLERWPILLHCTTSRLVVRTQK